jgi:hypothetical protein
MASAIVFHIRRGESKTLGFNAAMLVLALFIVIGPLAFAPLA